MMYVPVNTVIAPHIAMQLERYNDGLVMRSKNMLLCEFSDGPQMDNVLVHTKVLALTNTPHKRCS
jgi:hypothetical protein